MRTSRENYDAVGRRHQFGVGISVVVERRAVVDAPSPETQRKSVLATPSRRTRTWELL
jgi:hypothetical protein